MKKIPHVELLEIYEEYEFIDSPLVSIPEDSGIVVDMQYPILGMKHAIKECLVRKEVLEKLIDAKNNLPDGLTFKIWDAYRTLELQKEIYDVYRQKIIEKFELSELSKGKQDEVIKKYVSLPNKNEKLPPLHITGGAVDLTLIKADTKEELDIGVKFDTFSDLAASDAFEREGMDEIIKINRRILYHAMTGAGFTNLPSEIWHYDYGDRAWAYYSKKPAIYKGIFK